MERSTRCRLSRPKHTLPGSGNETEHVLHTTLLDLVVRATDVTSDEHAAVASVLEQLRSGSACLTGNFRGAPVEALECAPRPCEHARGEAQTSIRESSALDEDSPRAAA